MGTSEHFEQRDVSRFPELRFVLFFGVVGRIH